MKGGFNASRLAVDEFAVDIAGYKLSLLVHHVHARNLCAGTRIQSLGIFKIKGGGAVGAVFGTGHADIGDNLFNNASGKFNMSHEQTILIFYKA
jgi:hypothetical protein